MSDQDQEAAPSARRKRSFGWGELLGGIVLGLAESFASAYLQTEYKDVVAFALLILVLLVRPTGLLGRPDVEKV